MKTSELKKLAAQFSDFIDSDVENIETKMREFWFTTFGYNNTKRESELLEYWKNSIKHKAMTAYIYQIDEYRIYIMLGGEKYWAIIPEPDLIAQHKSDDETIGIPAEVELVRRVLIANDFNVISCTYNDLTGEIEVEAYADTQNEDEAVREREIDRKTDLFREMRIFNPNN